MKTKNQIEKINRETHAQELKDASELNGLETPEELDDILAECLDIQGALLLGADYTSWSERKNPNRFTEDDPTEGVPGSLDLRGRY